MFDSIVTGDSRSGTSSSIVGASPRSHAPRAWDLLRRGLTIFLVPLRPSLSWVIGVGTVAAYTMYLTTIFLPILNPQCPYRTPLSDLVYFPCHYITQALFPKHVHPLFVKGGLLYKFTLRAKISSLDDLERAVVQEESETLSVEALHWLFSSSFNPTVHGIVVQSIGGLPLSARAAVEKVFGEATHIRSTHNTLLAKSIQPSRYSLKPFPGMESKFGRLLRFELFIPNLLHHIYHSGQSRPYVDAADDWALTVAVQSNDTLQRSKYKPPDSPTSTAFFRQVTRSDPMMLPPVIWLKLMRMAKDEGAFTPIDIDSLDVFPMHLYSGVVPWKAHSIKATSPLVPVYFETAASDYFFEEFTIDLLSMFSAFDELTDKTSFPPTFTLALAFVRYLLHRLSLSSALDTDTQYTVAFAMRDLWAYIRSKTLPDDQVAALSDLVEHVVIHSPVFKLGPEWTAAQRSLVDLYSAMVGASPLDLPGHRPRHNFWPVLRPLVEFLGNQYDAPYDTNLPMHAPFDTMCGILGLGLRHGVEIVYDVFLETRCLEVFGGHSLRPSLVDIINGYVAGLAAPHASIDFQRHLDYLHEPENLFLACCILTTNGWNAFGKTPSMLGVPPTRLSGDICSDIRALASLRLSDPSWINAVEDCEIYCKMMEGSFSSSSRNGRCMGSKSLSPRPSTKRRVISVWPWTSLMGSFLIQRTRTFITR